MRSRHGMDAGWCDVTDSRRRPILETHLFGSGCELVERMEGSEAARRGISGGVWPLTCTVQRY